jgi:hypothetical protein
MLAVGTFWLATIILTVCALGFVIPPLWLGNNVLEFPKPRQIALILLISIAIFVSVYVIYFKIGHSTYLTNYYTAENIELRKTYSDIRPLYARLQREMVKNQLDLNLDYENIELVLYFAQMHSQVQQGILQPVVRNLLHAVLNSIPQQVTALNLLAIDAYKTQRYTVAVDYWQAIVEQFTPDLRNSAVEKVLLDKIQEAKYKATTRENL